MREISSEKGLSMTSDVPVASVLDQFWHKANLTVGIQYLLPQVLLAAA